MNKNITLELSRIAARHGGLLHPEDVVDAASDPRSVLHSRFEWDDTAAAHAHRLWQARQLIKVSVTVTSGIQHPMFMSVSVDRNDTGGYRPTASIMKDPEHREQLLADAMAELRLFKKKYALLVELADVFEAIKKVAKK